MFKLARKSYFDDLFDNFFQTPSLNNSLLSTDIKDFDGHYELKVDVPGFLKDDIKITLDNGYLQISANKEKEEKSDDGYYLRQERVKRSAVRKFYVGNNIKEEDIKAKLDNGVLVVEVPKIEEKEEVERLIEIK